MSEEAGIVLIVFGTIGVMFLGWFYLRFRARMEMQHTMRLALEKGNELSPDFIKQLGEPPRAGDRDLRRGLISLALALGFAALGLAVPEDEATQVMMGVAAFPFFIGLAFVIMHRFGNKNES